MSIGPLDRLRRLRPAGAAERRGRNRVRGDRAARGLDLRDRVDAARHQPRQVGQERAERRIRARVGEDVEPVREELPVAVGAEREVTRCARPCGSPTMLSLRVSVQRTGLPSRRASQATSMSSTPSIFAPKPPPTSGLMTRTWSGLEAEHCREPLPVLVGRLRREPGGEPAVGAHLGRSRARLERARRHPLADQRPGDDDVAAVEEVLVVLRLAAACRRRSSPPRGRGAPRRSRLLHVGDDRQRVVVDRHELGRVRTGGAVLADHDRDDLADEADDVRRDERTLHPGRHAERRRRRHGADVDVRAGQDLHARQGLGGRWRRSRSRARARAASGRR